jgi:uncharacterized membrane protein
MRIDTALAVLVASSSLLLAPSARAQLVTPPPPGVPGSLFVPVELPAPSGGRLEMFFGKRPRDEVDDDAWRTVCQAPCQTSLPAGARLRVTGNFASSPPFVLPRRSVSLGVEPVSSYGRGVGMALVVPGFLLTSLGTYALASEPPSEDKKQRELTQQVLGVGIAMLGAGLYLAITRWQTSVHLGAAPAGVALGGGVRIGARGVTF